MEKDAYGVLRENRKEKRTLGFLEIAGLLLPSAGCYAFLRIIAVR